MKVTYCGITTDNGIKRVKTINGYRVEQGGRVIGSVHKGREFWHYQMANNYRQYGEAGTLGKAIRWMIEIDGRGI